MEDVINSWKNENVFQKQLELNQKEISTKQSYPAHWNAFISFINHYNPKTILDVGCGCGTYYELCNKEFSGLTYTGVDYAEEAINIAKKTWNYSGFYVKDCLSLTEEYVLNYDLIHLGALLDVLPNGDEVLEHILSIKPKSVLIGRMKLTDKESYYDTYTAYNEIITCAYYHNKTNFINLTKKYGYEIFSIDNNFYLKQIV